MPRAGLQEPEPEVVGRGNFAQVTRSGLSAWRYGGAEGARSRGPRARRGEKRRRGVPLGANSRLGGRGSEGGNFAHGPRVRGDPIDFSTQRHDRSFGSRSLHHRSPMSSKASSSQKTIPATCRATRRCFTENVRRLAKRQGLSINALADQSGVSRAQMFNVLRGNSSPSLDWISKVAPVLGVFPWELLVSPEVVQGAQLHAGGPPVVMPMAPATAAPRWGHALPPQLPAYGC